MKNPTKELARLSSAFMRPSYMMRPRSHMSVLPPGYDYIDSYFDKVFMNFEDRMFRGREMWLTDLLEEEELEPVVALVAPKDYSTRSVEETEYQEITVDGVTLKQKSTSSKREIDGAKAPYSAKELWVKPPADIEFIQKHVQSDFVEDLGPGKEKEKVLAQFKKDSASFETPPSKIYKYKLISQQEPTDKKAHNEMKVWFQTEKNKWLYSYKAEYGSPGKYKLETI